MSGTLGRTSSKGTIREAVIRASEKEKSLEDSSVDNNLISCAENTYVSQADYTMKPDSGKIEKKSELDTAL